MAREYLNRAVEGGQPKLVIPSGVYNIRALGDHAKGRTDTMAEIILQAAFLRSAGLLPVDTKPISASGAKYQDFANPGTPHYVMAHRATLTVTVGGLNFVHFVGQRYRFRELLIAPQARTDPLPPPANYADVLFEIVSKDKTMALLQQVLRIQRPGQAVESNAIVHAVGTLKTWYSKCFDEAIDKSQAILELRGWERELVQMKNARQQSLLDESLADRLEECLAPQEGGPSRFGEYPQALLAMSKADADRAPTPLLNRDRVLESCEKLAEASAEPPMGSSVQDTGE